MSSKFSMILLLLFTAAQARAVSRIGGGKIQSLKSGFEMNIASSFQVADIQTEAVRCLGPLGLIQRGNSRSFGTQFFEITEFAYEFPDAETLDSVGIKERFAKSGWSSQSQNSCPMVLKLRTDSAIAYLATWAPGKGFVMKGTATPQTEQAMREALSSLKITGGCAWK